MKITAEIRELTECEQDALALAAMPYGEAWENARRNFEAAHDTSFYEAVGGLHDLGLTDDECDLTVFGRAALDISNNSMAANAQDASV